MTPSELLAAEVERDGARPLFTFYDDSAGARVELSVATTANWVAKTAGFLVDEYDVQPGDDVVVRLPLHWQAAVVVLACWAVGGRLAFDGDGVVTFAHADDTSQSDDNTIVRLALDPMGADFSALVAAQPDRLAAVTPSGDDVVAAAATDLPAGARVLTIADYDRPGALSYGLVSPLVVQGSVVMLAHHDADRLAEHAVTERATHSFGATVPGVHRLDG